MYLCGIGQDFFVLGCWRVGDNLPVIKVCILDFPKTYQRCINYHSCQSVSEILNAEQLIDDIVPCGNEMTVLDLVKKYVS